MKRTYRRMCCTLLCMALALSAVLPTGFAQTVETPRAVIERLQTELNVLDAKIAADQSDPEKAALVQEYYAQKSSALKSQITEINAEREAAEAALSEKQQQLEMKLLARAYTETLFQERLRAMYTTKNNSALSVLLGVTSYAEMMRYTENLQAIAVEDTALIATLREQGAELEAQIEVVQADLDALRNGSEELDVKSNEYAESLQLSEQLTAEQAQAKAEQEAYAAQRAKQEKAEAEWSSWISGDSAPNIVFGGGTLQWPIPGYYTLSSQWGIWRNVNGYKRVHSGIDIPAPAGTPIYAAAGGVVSTTAHWSYGTCVKIDHGSSLSTIYGHMSARVVKDGDKVETGDLIGYVGSTGNSTGNHLHFQVNVNGSYVNPFTYLNT